MKKNKNSGFSLVELIIVIAIMAVIIGVIAPQYIKYISKSREAVCQTNMDTLIREYQVETISRQPSTVEEAKALLREIVEAHGGTVESEGTSFYTGGVYSGFCKDGGTYSCMFSGDFLIMSIDCSVHGENIIDVKTLKERLEQITFDDIPGFAYKDLNAYFKNNPSLDSEAVSTDSPDKYGKYGSLAKAVSEKLTEQGINTTNRSWRMYKKNSEYNLFLTDRKIAESDVDSGDWIDCVKYDIAKQEIIPGKLQVVWSANHKYPIIQGSSFQEVK